MKQDQDGHDLTVRHLKLSIPAFFVCLFEGLFLDCFIKKLGVICWEEERSELQSGTRMSVAGVWLL